MNKRVKIAFLFPGQESVIPQMGLELASCCHEAQRLLEHARQVTQVDIFRLLKRGGRTLMHSEIMQPTMVAVSLGALAALSTAGVQPDFVAGLSLGELSAWCAAGCISPDDIVELAATRGRIMGQVANRNPGGLLALQVSSEADVEKALQIGRTRGFVSIASRNAPDQIVLTGDNEALRAISRNFHSTRLSVSGPWHSPLMAEALKPLRTALVKLPRYQANAQFISNRTARPVDDSDKIPDLLAEQMTHPVLWSETLNTLARTGVTDYITIGPGKILRSLLHKTLGPWTRVHTTEDPDDVDRTIAALNAPLTRSPSPALP